MTKYSINLQTAIAHFQRAMQTIGRRMSPCDHFHFWDAQEDLDRIVWNWTNLNLADNPSLENNTEG